MLNWIVILSAVRAGARECFYGEEQEATFRIMITLLHIVYLGRSLPDHFTY